MAWNEKALKQFRMKPKQKIDTFDREAEAEGNATRFFNHNEVKPQLGRRIAKTTRKADGLAKTAEAKATANLVKDTAKFLHQVSIPQHQLRQA